MTGTALDKDWVDLSALHPLVSNHPFTSVSTWRAAFRSPSLDGTGTRPPAGPQLQRMTAWLNAWTLCMKPNYSHLPKKHITCVPVHMKDDEGTAAQVACELHCNAGKGARKLAEANRKAKKEELSRPQPGKPSKADMAEVVLFIVSRILYPIMHLQIQILLSTPYSFPDLHH